MARRRRRDLPGPSAGVVHDPRAVLAIIAGGAVGTLGRAALSQAWPHDPTSWPWATFVVNLVAAAVLGWTVTWLETRRPRSRYRRPLIGTGFCGGLSTFSTMQLEILRMVQAHAVGLAVGYTLASIAAGLAAVQLGTTVARNRRGPTGTVSAEPAGGTA